MNRLAIYLSSLMAMMMLSACWGGLEKQDMYDSPVFNSVKGIYTYNDYSPLKSKPVKIHYYIPNGDVTAMPILFVLPGINRNADDYLNAWTSMAEQKGVMVFSLEFPSQYYSNEEYNEGGMMSASSILPEKDWTFSVIEPIFEFIVKDLKGFQSSFDMWGHSAGAQFVHRYFLFKPYAPIGTAVSANAGWYTVPDADVEFPYGLKSSPSNENSLKKAFSNKLIVHLGTADTDPNDSNLNHSAGAELQGAHRYDRGLYFWNKSMEISSSYLSFSWEKNEEEGVAHDYKKMAASAAGIMY